YGLSLPGPDDGMSFSLGWAHLLIAAIVLAVWRRKAFWALAAIAICWLMTENAHAIWDALPQLQYVAFPWRLLASATVCIALIIAAAKNKQFIAVESAVITLTNLSHVRPAGRLAIDPQDWTPKNIAMSGKIAATFD